MNLQTVFSVFKPDNIKILIVIYVCSVIHQTVAIAIRDKIRNYMVMAVILPSKNTVDFIVVADVSLAEFPYAGWGSPAIRACFRPFKTGGIAIALHTYRYGISHYIVKPGH